MATRRRPRARPRRRRREVPWAGPSVLFAALALWGATLPWDTAPGAAAQEAGADALTRDQLKGVIQKEVSEALEKAFESEDADRPATVGDVKQAVEDAVSAAVAASVRTNRLIERGRALYRQACQACHGAAGDGRGEAARHLDPKPRDLSTGVFKFRSTQSGALPTDADLARTIRVGAPGTAMPAFGPMLSEGDIEALVAFVKTLSARFGDPDYALAPHQIVKIPAERPYPPTAGSPKLGREVYERMQCARCHGDAGKGDGPTAADLVDDDGRPIAPPNLTTGVFKSGAGDVDLFRTLSTGLDGTPMPSYGEVLTEAERWALVDYLRFLSSRSVFTWMFWDPPE